MSNPINSAKCSLKISTYVDLHKWRQEKMETPLPETSGNKQALMTGVRTIVLNLPEDEGEGLGFRLTRTLWDPYPWIREVTPGGRADKAGLKTGDCLLQADGRDLLGLPIGQVAGLIRGDGSSRSVTLDLWNCGVDPEDDPELLWSCGGGSRGEKSRRALSGVIKALACSVCASTATNALNCARSHIYCEACWARLDKCALCREPLPAKNSPYAKNLVAEQVFEAIAAEYELKIIKKKCSVQSVSAYTSPNRSPNLSPVLNRRGQYQLSIMNRNKKAVHFSERFGQTYASEPNIHRSSKSHEIPDIVLNSTNFAETSQAGTSGNSCHNESDPICETIANSTNTEEMSKADNSASGGNIKSSCSCQNEIKVPKINIENIECGKNNAGECSQNYQRSPIQHKLVARLRQACSLADLQSATVHCPITGSFNNSDKCKHHTSLDNLKNHCNAVCDSTLFLLPATPIYVVSCDHNKK